MTHVSSKHAYTMSGVITGAFKVGLWAVLDSQYQDACAYTLDFEHEITSGISEEEILKLETEASHHAENVFSGFLTYSVVGFVTIMGLLFWLIATNGNA